MSLKKSPLVSLIILNWNGLDDTKSCIKSIEKIKYPNKEVIIIDNGSTDGSKEYFSKLHGLTYIYLPENTGFTGGHIEGIKVAKGEYIGIINNDLVLDSAWIENCLDTFAKQANVALVGGKALKWNEHNPPYNTDNEFYSYQEVDPVTGYTRTLLVGEEECQVDSISGAALLIKRSSIDDVGYFDNDFFAYYEETDLIARLMRKGYVAYFNPRALTWHKIASSTGTDSPFYLYMMHRNRYFYAYKNFDDTYVKQFVRFYKKEAFFALFSLVRNRKNLDSRSRVKAYLWTRKNTEMLGKSRTKVQKLGGTYSEKLRQGERTDVTVIIPCYNYGNFVNEAIDSVLAQTLLPKKIIVINDGSTDNSKQTIDKYKQNPLVEIIHKKNSGVIDTKNIGINMSKTYWTLFLDADDQIEDTFLEDTIEISKNGAKDIIYTDMLLFGAVNDIFRARPFSIHTLLKTNYINNSALIKTSLLRQIGGYKPQMNHGLEDWELYISLVEIGAKPQYLPVPLMKYRQHIESLSRNSKVNDNEKELLKQIKSLHLGFYRKHGYYKTVFIHGLKLLLYMVRYPGLILVIFRSIPKAIKKAMSYTYSQGLAYIQKKIGIV